MLGHPAHQQIETIKFEVSKLFEICDKTKVDQILALLTELQNELPGTTPQTPPSHIQRFIEEMMLLSKFENEERENNT